MRQIQLGHERQRLAAARAVEQGRPVRLSAEPGPRLRDIVGHDQVQRLPAQLGAGALDQITGFGRKTDDTLTGPARRQIHQDVRRRFERQRSRAAPLRNFSTGRSGGPEVGNRRRHDQDIGLRKPGDHFLPHVLGGHNRHDGHVGNRRQPGGARNQDHLGSAIARGFGERPAHLPGGAVRDEPDRVERLLRRTGCDEHAPAFAVLDRMQRARDRRQDRVLFRKTPFAGSTGGQRARFGLQHENAALSERPHVVAHRLVGPHAAVHGRRHHHRTVRRQRQRGEQVVGEAMRQFRHAMGRRGRDHDQIGRFRQREVGHDARPSHAHFRVRCGK